MSMTYDEILGRIGQELAMRFTDPNDPGLYERRQRLHTLFDNVPPDHARELFARLSHPNGDALGSAFVGRLATPTRNEMLRLLQQHFPADTPAPEPAAPETPTPPFPTDPLPPDCAQRFATAVAALQQQIAAANDDRAWRYRCWLDKLAAGGDDRVIQWHRICPATSGAIGAAYIVGACDLAAGTPVDQKELQDAIHAVADVEPANQRLQFITHMRSNILFDYEMVQSSLLLENFRIFHDDVVAAIDKLGKWANNPMGGSSAMPPAYVSIKDWIGARQRDPGSVYNCQ